MTSVLDARDIDVRFRTGLIFSIFEGLLQGGKLQIISDQPPQDLENQFEAAHLPHQSWEVAEVEKGVWKITMTKAPKEGCCGLCKGE